MYVVRKERAVDYLHSQSQDKAELDADKAATIYVCPIFSNAICDGWQALPEVAQAYPAEASTDDDVVCRVCHWVATELARADSVLRRRTCTPSPTAP